MSTTTLRRCVGSERFGIEAHEAPTSDFPAQPSQPDGLGRMCKVHWREYTSGLRRDALSRKGEASAEQAPAEPEAGGRRTAKAAPEADRPARATRTRRSRPPSAQAGAVRQAEALIAEVDALPGPEAVKRVGDADVQAALETAVAARMLAD